MPPTFYRDHMNGIKWEEAISGVRSTGQRLTEFFFLENSKKIPLGN